MRHWSQLGTRNWRARPGRTALATAAIALGVAVVVWVTGCFESVRRSITEVVLDWIGRSHVMVESIEGRWGLFDAAFLDRVRALPEVSAAAARTMELIEAAPTAGRREALYDEIEITGIDPALERQFRTHVLVAGRFLDASDEHAVLAEVALANEWGFAVGDKLKLRRAMSADPPRTVAVVGLLDRRRATPNALPMLWAPIADVQAVCALPGRIKGVDVMLRDASPEGVRRGADLLRAAAREHQKASNETLKVSTTEAQLAKLAAAQGLLRFILLLSAGVLLLTAFFIIAATMSMGIVERVTQIGLMRCVGVTGGQVAVMILCESLPIGVAGVLIGVPAGFALQWLTVELAGDFLGAFMVSRNGVWLAIAGGMGTALLGAALPAMRALLVSPIEASRPLAKLPRARWLAAAGLVGALLVVSRRWLAAESGDASDAGFDLRALGSILMLYAGYALLAAPCVALGGRLLLPLVAIVVAVPAKMLGEQVHKSPWRSAALCAALMVGLSMIVGLVVWGRSVRAGWSFPREFPEALVYSWSPVPFEAADSVRAIPGLRDLVVADEFHVTFRRPPKPRTGLLGAVTDLLPTDKFSRFVAITPRELPRALGLTWLEGREVEALRQLEAGGHVLITRELAQAQNRHIGDSIKIWYNDEGHDFKIAGVIAAPALDIAVNFFNATEYFQIYAVGAVFGSRQDADHRFNRRYAKLLVFNFDRPALAASESGDGGPDGSADPLKPAATESRERPESEIALIAGEVPVSDAESADRARRKHPLFNTTADMMIASPREQAIVDEVKARLGGPGPFAFATAAQLKRQIDDNLDRVTLLLSAAPLVGLLVAALGVGNLMMASVASRRRQLAVLRAVGATRGQVMRMVLGEALLLGALGSLLGVALGVQLAHASNGFTMALTGERPELEIPWRLLAFAAVTVCGLCAAAGLIPARVAARDSVIMALQHG